ncbi:hypothetical protein GA0115251_135817 [Streptomyces sp. TverLS-915]|uniref:hypothetical protein n=1 Tax=Streptomyces sp. TverLS-915 TaxID=1839763 RepID=UPI00081E7A1B|nr:hypothetical protein [Streptomyces sp. TverLS-915]SCE02394.1 hypothetical protein GA0115251_135817 [Streptomyces sp. TverLS-915]
MTENVNPDEATAPTAQAPAPPEPAPAEPTPTEPAPTDPARARSRLRTGLAYALPLLVLLGSGVGSVVYATSSSESADRTVATRQWDRDALAAPPKTDFGKGGTSGALQRQLLPVPEGYRLGPYVSKDGNDLQLGGREIRDALTSGTLGSADADRVEELLRSSAPRALAMRSYVTPDRESAYYVVLTQTKEGKGPSAASSFKTLRKLLESVFEKESEVPGHAKDAFCVRPSTPPTADGEKSGIELVTCLGVHGDLLATLDVTSSDRVGHWGAGRFFARQLDRLKSTGTAV